MSAPTAFKSAVESRLANLGMSENLLAERTAIPRSTLRRRLEVPRTLYPSELEQLANALELDGTWLAALAVADPTG